MRPMSLFERGLGAATVSLAELLRGDRPEISGQTTVALSDYVHEILRSGFETIRDGATAGSQEKPSRGAVGRYWDVLERLHVLDPIPAWLPTRNYIARLGAAPKHHLVDPALAAQLLNVDADALLSGRPVGPGIARDGPLLGALFESLVTERSRLRTGCRGNRRSSANRRR